MIDVEDKSEDGLSREVWSFQWRDGALTLVRYATENRKTTRHKWRLNEQWERADERPYNSQLSRPTEIPDWVIDDAVTKLRAMPVRIYIAFNDYENHYKDFE